MLTIFRGDDTGGTLGKRLEITVETDLPLTGCELRFNFCGILRTFTGVSSGDTIEVFFSHNETRTFPVGVQTANISAVDSAGKVRTITNSLPIKVTNNVAECYGSDASSITIRIHSTVTWSDIGNKPFQGQTVDLKNDNDLFSAVGTIVEFMGGQVNG